MNKKRKVAKSGYVGVYKNSRGSLYHYDSYLSSDPYKKSRKTVSGFKTAEEAYKAKKKYEDEVRNIIKSNLDNPNMGYLIDKYLEWKKANVKITTYHHIKKIVKKYLKHYSEFSVEKFTSSSGINKFINDLLNINPMTFCHKYKILRVVKDMFNHGLSTNYVDEVYARKVFNQINPLMNNVPKTLKKENYWSKDEWKKFIQAIDQNDKWYVFFTLYKELGCHINEMLGLQNHHIHLNEGYITIEQQAISNIGIGKTTIVKTESHNVPISKEMSETLKQYFLAFNAVSYPDNFLFFENLYPISIVTVRRQFKYYVKQIGLPRITL